jgi:hypothetical protein
VPGPASYALTVETCTFLFTDVEGSTACSGASILHTNASVRSLRAQDFAATRAHLGHQATRQAYARGQLLNFEEAYDLASGRESR